MVRNIREIVKPRTPFFWHEMVYHGPKTSENGHFTRSLVFFTLLLGFTDVFGRKSHPKRPKGLFYPKSYSKSPNHALEKVLNTLYGSSTKGLVCVGEVVGKIGEVGERELVLVVSVTYGIGWDMTHGWQLFQRHKDAQSLSMSHACSRDEMWSCCATLYVLCLWVCCSHHPSVVWRFFSRQQKLVLTLRKISQVVRPWRMLRIPTGRLPMGSIRIWWRWRSCRQVSPRLFVEPPACFRSSA